MGSLSTYNCYSTSVGVATRYTRLVDISEDKLEEKKGEIT
jgi:hypothetical protein